MYEINHLCQSCYPVSIYNPVIPSTYSCTDSPFSDLLLKGILDTIRPKTETCKNIFFDSRCWMLHRQVSTREILAATSREAVIPSPAEESVENCHPCESRGQEPMPDTKQKQRKSWPRIASDYACEFPFFHCIGLCYGIMMTPWTIYPSNGPSEQGMTRTPPTRCLRRAGTCTCSFAASKRWRRR